ncbi:hypothetical protein DFR44_12215 [Hydromonas duriensis]|uniref:Uncharacterized protein n=1 Tax=Hydromonas duriensis TaxID=1527608 RepID=A0A4R6Y1N4_9BURK|nr:hypothetical protein DFR44_12215 [Hydromonas duriensis]
MPALASSRAKYLQSIKELADGIAIIRGYPLQTVEDLTVSRASEFVTGKAWLDAQKREEDLISAQFDAVKAIVKTNAAVGNGIIKSLGH